MDLRNLTPFRWICVEPNVRCFHAGSLNTWYEVMLHSDTLSSKV